MRGAVAAGHPLTAEAGASVLRAGGNAVDACVGAAFVSWVCESPLTGPGGGGFMLVHDGETRLLDFFVAQPSGEMGAPMVEVDVGFTSDESQVFHVGKPSVAVPGTLLGLETAHRQWGTVPWAELIAPAVALARAGVVMTKEAAYLHAILDGLLRREPEGAAFYGPERLTASDRFRPLDLAATLQKIAAEGAAAIYGGELGERIVAHVQSGGGALTRDDLASYRVVSREPLSVPYRGHEFRTNPPPSSGGRLIALGLQELHDEVSADAIGRAMRAQDRARVRASGGTTHISVVDGKGDAASLSSSLGSGSGVVVPGTGIHLNNVLGEWDLAADVAAGERLTSMMAPSVVLRDGRPRLVLGSAGSARLRGAILQVVVNVIGRGLSVEDAVNAPRVHLEEDVLHAEGGHEESALEELEAAGWELVRWKRRNLFFGGVSAVEVRDDGTLAAAGDPRRGGAGVVVA